MFILGIPLLVISFAVYNIIAFLMPTLSWDQELLAVPLPSHSMWGISIGDLLVAASILVLLIEIAKSTRISTRTIVDHLLSIVLLVGMVAEFLLVREAATPTFFLLLVVAFVDVVGGFAVTARASRREIKFTGIEALQATASGRAG